MAIGLTKYGSFYEHPDGINEEDYYSLIEEFVELAKEKGLTTRQAQKLFSDCKDCVLDSILK